MLFLEYSDYMVEMGFAAARLCSSSNEKKYIFTQLARADRVYSIKNGVVTTLKDRHNGDVKPYRIGVEEELMLRLRATPI